MKSKNKEYHCLPEKLLQKIHQNNFQEPGWTLSDNSLNMQLYYKDRFHLTENGNINFSKLIIETLQDV